MNSTKKTRCQKGGKPQPTQGFLFRAINQLFPLLCITFALFGPIVSAAPCVPQVDTCGATDENPRYWITASSGKTHNSSCRYYKKSKGHGSDTPSGNNCKICGGASKG